MATEVDICNLALAHLGNAATVASINPPEGSSEADHCARFYPIARDTLLEMHAWCFALKRVALAQLTTTASEWQYAYASPNDAVNLLAVLPPDATDDVNAQVPFPSDSYGLSAVQVYNPVTIGYTPQPYSAEIDATGTQIILTNQEQAVLRYTALITDTSLFSPLFTLALTWHLAAMLAGPVLKGESGITESQRATKMMAAILSQAKSSDANQHHNVTHVATPWIAGR
jgi:hypothetical protein